MVYKQGDRAETIFVVLSGRLRSVVKRADGTKELVSEFVTLQQQATSNKQQATSRRMKNEE